MEEGRSWRSSLLYPGIRPGNKMALSSAQFLRKVTTCCVTLNGRALCGKRQQFPCCCSVIPFARYAIFRVFDAYGYNNVFRILVLCVCSCFGVYLCHVACERCSHRCCILCDESILWCLFDLFSFFCLFCTNSSHYLAQYHKIKFLPCEVVTVQLHLLVLY